MLLPLREWVFGPTAEQLLRMSKLIRIEPNSTAWEVVWLWSDRLYAVLNSGSSYQWAFTKWQVLSSAVSNSLQPHGLQHARLPCPSPTPRACSNACPPKIYNVNPTNFITGLWFPKDSWRCHCIFVVTGVGECQRIDKAEETQIFIWRYIF